MGEGARGRWLGSDGRWRPGPPPEGWWQERGGGGRWYPPALANHPAARRPPGMPRPWARERDRDAADDRDAAGDKSDGGDPPSGAEGGGDEASAADDPASFPTLDPPWPDGEMPVEPVADVPESLDADDGADAGVGGELSPVLRLEPSWDEPPPCRVPRRPLRPEHRRRSRHSFEPADLNDVELDRLLRGPSVGGGGRGGGRPGGWPGGRPGGRRAVIRPWPVWAKVVLAAAAMLAGLGVLGALEATAGDTTDTITTRGEGQRPVRSIHGPTSTSSVLPVGELRDDVDCPGSQGDGSSDRDDQGC